MLPLINLPVKIVKLFSSNTSASEVAAGVCLGMFMGFIPLNGPMAILLLLCFFIFRINRLAAMLVLPLFKLLYVLGVSGLADIIGGYLLIQADYLIFFWRQLTHLPVVAYLDLNNTLVAGGLFLSWVLCIPVYIFSKKGIVIIREKYFDRIKNSAFVKWFKNIPLISKILSIIGRLKGEE
ncbi:MAG: TIGR03546 family protein [Candidatus Omnitrophota bacterium]|nr:TIGR03546 family protein [Candidatus Omnitrophota bacterium]